MAHIINRLQFQLTCSDEDQAFNFRQNFAITYQEQLTEAADNICSKHAADDEWLRIDKLEIDLGHFSPASFDDAFASAFKINFEKELTQKLSAIPSSQKKTSLQVSKTELFKYFLLKGILPWWADESSIDFNDLCMEVLTSQPATAKHFFYQNRLKKNVWFRTAFQLSTEAKAKVIILIEELSSAKSIFVLWLQQVIDLLQKETGSRLNVSLIIVDDMLLKNAPQIFQTNQNLNELLQIFKFEISETFSEKNNTIKKTITNYNDAFIQAAKEISINQSSMVDAYLNLNKFKNQTTGEPATDVQLNEEKIYEATENDSENITDKYAVKHAGIILLAPFLKSFFTNLHLLAESNWRNKEAQYKAVHLLKFLCTGLQHAPEYNLMLEKIICGFSIEEPVPLKVLLTEEEMNESTSLLESVIEHWKSLKNTSINGLRETFLKRDGLLTKNENGWLLQVERKTLDILIDSIPWGYSMNSFSWSSNIISVEW